MARRPRPVAVAEDGVQVVRTTQVADGYVPASATIQAGQPTRWLVDSTESQSCAIFLTVPSLGIQVMLEPGENEIMLPPLEAGRVAYTLLDGHVRRLVHGGRRANRRVPGARAPAADPRHRASSAACLPSTTPCATLDERFLRAREEGKIPGVAWGVVRDGALVHAGGAGTIRDGEALTPDADSIFRIASMTKSFTAAAILLLRDEGRLRLDDPAATYVPQLAGWSGPDRRLAPDHDPRPAHDVRGPAHR